VFLTVAVSKCPGPGFHFNAGLIDARISMVTPADKGTLNRSGLSDDSRNRVVASGIKNEAGSGRKLALFDAGSTVFSTAFGSDCGVAQGSDESGKEDGGADSSGNGGSGTVEPSAALP